MIEQKLLISIRNLLDLPNLLFLKMGTTCALFELLRNEEALIRKVKGSPIMLGVCLNAQAGKIYGSRIFFVSEMLVNFLHLIHGDCLKLKRFAIHFVPRSVCLTVKSTEFLLIRMFIIYCFSSLVSWFTIDV